MAINDDLIGRARHYAQQHGLTLGEALGAGVHGIVHATESQRPTATAPLRSAIKAHRREADYGRERDVYMRLQHIGVRRVCGCHVPQLLRYDDDLWIIEMTLVSRPFVLDFAGAFLDQPPEFSAEVLDEWHAEKQEQFGPRWADAQAVVHALQHYGVYLVDVNPGNIAFVDQE